MVKHSAALNAPAHETKEMAGFAHNHYVRLMIMTGLSFLAMYALMYAMVDRFANVYPNLNNAYMAGLMASPMVIIELAVMGAMYPDRRWNAVFMAAGAIALAGFFLLIRQQTAISDEQFLKSMIPHHAGAVLMCNRAPIEDAGIRQLCSTIVSGQQSEIDWMKAKLAELKG